MTSLGVDRDTVWTLIRLPISTAFPLELRVRILDFMLMKDSIILVSALLVRLGTPNFGFHLQSLSSVMS